jgi:hypothetical protein
MTFVEPWSLTSRSNHCFLKYYLKTIIWPLGQRSRSHEGHYGMRHTALWSCTHIPNKYLLKTIIWPWGQRSRSHEGHLFIWCVGAWPQGGVVHTVMTFVEPWSLTSRSNHCFLNSIFKVPRKSLRYATHRLMIMHQHTKYHWPISKEKNVMDRTRKYYLKKQLFDLEVNDQGPTHNIFVFRNRSMIFGMWVHDHKAVCRVP